MKAIACKLKGAHATESKLPAVLPPCQRAHGAASASEVAWGGAEAPALLCQAAGQQSICMPHGPSGILTHEFIARWWQSGRAVHCNMRAAQEASLCNISRIHA